ncbi:SpoIIE family protein phosphatase [Streptomyces sp. NPDC002004]
MLDLLGVAAVVVDAEGRIVLWSPQATQLFGYRGDEAVGRYAARLLASSQDLDAVIRQFGDVMATGQTWVGLVPVICKDGSRRVVEFRNMRLTDDCGDVYALGLATDEAKLHRMERDLALSTILTDQSPVGMHILDTGLRFLTVNPALERMDGVSAKDHLGRTLGEVLPDSSFALIEANLREVLASGMPLVDQYVTVRTPADPDEDHAWSWSFYRLEDARGGVLGVAGSVIDVTDRHRAAADTVRARQRLAMIADAAERIGAALNMEQTAQELAEVSVPELADVIAVVVLDSIMTDDTPLTDRDLAAAPLRVLAVKARFPSEGAPEATGPCRIAGYESQHVITQCMRTRRRQLVPRLADQDSRLIAGDAAEDAAPIDGRAHSYLAVPLIARSEILGVASLVRTRNPLPFSEEDGALAYELASRAAIGIDNARWYQNARTIASTLQRGLLPGRPSQQRPGLDITAEYFPAGAAGDVGGDWYDVIALAGDKTALVVGDVMGNGIEAAATMGQLRTATSTLAGLGLSPVEVLHHLDRTTSALEHYIATVAYAVYDPRHRICEIASAGHPPPVLMRRDQPPELLGFPTGVPLGAGSLGSTPEEAVLIHLAPGDQLLMYTDGLIGSRRLTVDERLEALLQELITACASAEERCRHLVKALREPEGCDDVALLIARVNAT